MTLSFVLFLALVGNIFDVSEGQLALDYEGKESAFPSLIFVIVERRLPL